MDYDDNESEGQNLNLAGEESSKNSSVLRPFTYPKFDFDDSLHGHLRFDSLVENEVFLGITSQEDNNWIEDITRGSSGIVFSSSAAESCALPRHINVWSEATSTESVELLLKAVGQEEMASGEHTTEEPCPNDQPGSSIVQMDNLTVDGNGEEVDNEYGSVTPDGDIHGDLPRSDQNVGVNDDTTGCISPSREISFPSHEVLADGKNSDSTEMGGKLIVEIKASSTDQVETGDLADDSLRNQVEENAPDPYSFRKASASVGESVHQVYFGNASLVGSNDVSIDIPDSVEYVQKEGSSTMNVIDTSKITDEATKIESLCSLEVPSQTKSSKEENTDKIQEGDTDPDETRNEAVHDVVNLLDVKSSISYTGKDESIVGLGAETNDVTQTPANTQSKPDIVPQSSVQHSHNDICPGSNSSFVDPPANFASSVPHDLSNNPPAMNLDGKIKDDDTSGNSTDCTVAGESSGKNLAVCSIRDSEYCARSVNEKIDALIHSPNPLPAANTEICREDCHSNKEDVCEREQGDPACEKEVRKSSLDKNEICDHKEEETGPNNTETTSERNVETAAGCQPDEFTVLNTEDDNTKLVSPSLQGDESMHSNKLPCSAPLFDAGYNNQSKESDSDSLKDTNSLKEPLGPNELAPDVGTEGIIPLGLAESGKLERNDLAISLVDSTTVDLLDESCKELSKNVEHSGSAQDDGADVPSAENLMEANHEISGTVSATIPVSSFTGTTTRLSAPDSSSSSPSKSLMDLEVSLEKSITEKVGEVLPTSSAATASCQAEESFTFDIRPLEGQSTVDTIKDSFPLNAEGTIATSGNHTQRDPELIKETSGSISARKARRGGSRSGKGTVKRGNQAKEIVTPAKQNDRGEKSAISLSPFGAGQLVTFDSAVKPRGPVVTTSNMPDLNSAAQSSTFFQQPFTDSQQVQLRAQIFVYGSLIQGIAPNEACMVSAFDGARHVWEPAWRACMERLRGQKSQGNNSETPVHLGSVGKGPEPTNSQVFSSGSVRSSNKTTPVINPAFPLSSPLWSMATPSIEALSTKVRGALFDHQAVSPLHTFQSPSSIRNFTAHTTWPSQSPFPVPWLSSSQSSPFGISTNYSSFPITEPVRLTPVKDSSSAISSGTNLVQTTPPAMHTGATAMFSGAPSHNPNNTKALSGQTSLDTRTRKRKKSSKNDVAAQGSVAASPVVSPSVPLLANYSLNRSLAPGDGSQFSLNARNNVNLPSTPVVSSHYSTSVAVSAPSPFVPRSTTSQLFSVGPTLISHNINRTVEQSKDRAAALNADGFKKVEDAKLHAQEATAHASEAIQQCESIWNQLKHQNNSGLTEDVESKLASAAAAVAAAACVAKAASAAANVALSAAVQAKLLAEEAVTKSGIGTEVNVSFMFGTPSLEISSVREASRRRVEAASAATRHAANLDAIVKAAELAAEAVSHTGKIVAMGDPFSVRKLIDAGPDNYWRVSNAADEPRSKTNVQKSNSAGIAGVGRLNLEGPEKNKVSGSSKIASLVPEHHFESGLNSVVPYGHQSMPNIKEGSIVEVLKDRGDQKEGWFSASVESLKDTEAFVCYKELRSDEGFNQLKEWVSLDSKDREAPRVRVPHPMTSVQFEGTKKRRRSAVKDYTWSVGDKVDAWVQDCWREGVVAEKNVKDTTSLGVHFSAGETLVVKLWHLRPTLVWTSGQWIEWCRPRKDGGSQGDSPMEKRPKLGSVDAKGKFTMDKSISFVETGQSEEARLPLSSNDKVFKFNIGSKGDGSKPTTVKSGRSVPDKGGSRVVFGVPKPGKKRKFMEVSKHYVSDRSTKVDVPDDSVKLARFLAPHGSGPRGLKNVSKVDKERQVAGSKAKVPKLGKPPSVPGRTVVQKDASSSSRENEQDEDTVKGSISNDEGSGEQKLAELSSSNVEETSGGNMVFSSQALPKEIRKKVLTKGGKSERVNQGKFLPTSGKLAKTEANEKIATEVAEPRRSNRRILPTSRLLEGLQSSLIISKTPSSSSHDKSHSSQNKGTTRGSK